MPAGQNRAATGRHADGFREAWAMVRGVIDRLTDEQLATEVTRDEPGWPRAANFPVKQCLRIILNEEWEHLLFAERDLTVPEKTT